MSSAAAATRRPGKLENGRLYVHRSGVDLHEGPLGSRILEADRVARCATEFRWNVTRLEEGDPHRVTLLLYEDFGVAPFPALLESARVDLRDGRIARRDFPASGTPPVLHRKERIRPAGAALRVDS